MAVSTPTRGPIVHIVNFKFARTTTPAQIQQVVAAFTALQTESVDPVSRRPLIRSFEYGSNNSEEGLTKGFTHSFVLTFATLQDRDYYVGNDHTKPFDPAHDRFKQLVGPLLDDGADGVMVIDFQDGVNQ